MLVNDGYWREGVTYNTSHLYVYDSATYDIALSAESYFMDAADSYYKRKAEEVRKATQYYYEEKQGINVFFTYYLINDKYVPVEDYDAMCARFTDVTDPLYQMRSGTYNVPLSMWQ